MFRTFITLLVALKVYALTSSVQQKIPVTILSGFLGSGKTTLLQHLLNNSEGIKIAVIVNDVAEVNIDNKLILGNTVSPQSKGNKRPAGIVELSNGCACCSISDELLPAVSELITLSDMRSQANGDDASFDHIVIELSGVASPKSIRSNFQEAELYGMPLLDRVKLDTMVTLIDCSSFLDRMLNDGGRKVAVEECPELFYKNDGGRDGSKEEQEEAMSIRSLSPSQWTPETATVSQLLTEQTEISDVILLNKVDIQSQDEKLTEIRDIVKMLNPRAKIYQTKFGIVNRISDVLAAASGKGVVDAGTVDDFKENISLYEEMNVSSTNKSIRTCNDPDCLDNSHSHTHDHQHGRKNTKKEDVCHDPNCNDHSHSHTHSHQRADSSGIGTFIYRARKPFHPQRLESVLSMLPAKRGISSFIYSKEYSESAKDTFRRVLRCKGFSWLANSHIACQFLSHAGSSFEMHILGRWWATLPRIQWPEEAIDEILSDFDNKCHEENDKLESVGDRRQEIVWIGPGLDKPEHQTLMQQCLDDCLLKDEEYEMYKNALSDENTLKEMFPTSIQSKMMSY